jgi:SAM-dependent methyltransferase
VLRLLKASLTKASLANAAAPAVAANLVQADLSRLPFASGVFDLAVSVNVINHGNAATFRDYCRELDRVLKPGGHLFIYTSPREAGEMVRLPQTRELEPGTLVDIATPDGVMVHHFPTPAELGEQFPRFAILRQEIVWDPIPFMNNVELPQLIFWGEKGR